MRPTLEDLARALANKLKGRDVGYQCCLDGSESIGVIVAALADARRAALIWAAAEIVREHRMDDRDGWLDLATKIRQRASEG